MLDIKVVVIGVAGVFVALGLAAAVMLGIGHTTNALGQELGSGPITQAGDAISAVGIDIVVFLMAVGVVVSIAFLYARSG